MMIFRPRNTIAAMALIASLSLVGCSTSAPSTEVSSASEGSSTVRIGSHIDVLNMDPLRSGAAIELQLLMPIYETLVRFDTQTGEPIPGIAESWEQTPDTLTFTIREDVTFHDGTPVDAEAVKFNIERALSDFSSRVSELSAIESVTVISDTRVELKLSTPDASLPALFAERAGMLVSPTAAEQNENDFSTTPVGAGAYKLVEWQSGVSISLEAYEGYWDDSIEIAPAMEIKIIPDGQTRVNALTSGQVDLVPEIPVANIQALESSAGIVIQSEPTLHVDQVFLNTGNEGLDDPRVRKALNMAVDRDSVVAAAYLGYGVPASTYFPESSWAHAAGLAYDYNIEAAQALMDEAGFGDGLVIDLVTSPARARVAEILKEQWSQIGVDVQIETKDTVSASEGFFKMGQGSALLSAWSGRIDPALTYKQMFLPGTMYNSAGNVVPGLDEALKATDEFTTVEDRTEPFIDAAEAVFDNAPNVPLSFTKVTAAMNEDVEGFHISLSGPHKFVGTVIASN